MNYGPYFNTTDLRREQLAQAYQNARNQNDRVLAWFNVMREGSPSQAHEALPNAPLTSVRRAITTLEKAGKLKKTDRQIDGPYGKPEHIWRLPRQLRLI